MTDAEQKILAEVDELKREIKELRAIILETRTISETDAAKNFLSGLLSMDTADAALKAKIDAAFYTLMNDPKIWFALDNLPHEVWRDVKNYEGLYQVSNMGRVKSFRGSKVRILQGHINLNGYVTVAFTTGGHSKSFFVHALVAQAFIPNPAKKDTVNHKRGKKSDNRVSELEWLTRSENMKHAFRIGLVKAKRRLSDDDVRYIRKVYKKGNHRLGAKALARQFGLDEKTIWLIANRKTYRDVI